MREILFCGRRLDNGAWETGSLVIIRGGISDEEVFIADKMTGYYTPVDATTIGEYIGKNDKNNMMIFEGDIVLSHDTKHEFIGRIDFADSCFRVIEYDGTVHCSFTEYEMEIIGNIHGSRMPKRRQPLDNKLLKAIEEIERAVLK